MNAPRLPGIEISADGRIGQLVLARPEKLNALSPQLLESLIEAAAWFDAQPDVRAVVVLGAGRAFTAGADLSAIGGSPGEHDDGAQRRALDLGRRAIDAIAGMRALTIAAIHGHCVGGGVVLVAACDLRIAAEDTRFVIPEVDLGIPLTWSGIPRLVRELGPAITKELVLTCRPFDAHEAHRIRLVNRVVPGSQLNPEAFALADKLASQPTYALVETKRHVNAVAEESGSTAQAHREADTLRQALGDDESRQAMARYLAGRS